MPVRMKRAKKLDRVTILRRIKGIWKNRKPDPINELKKMRREWDRSLPSLG